MRPEGLKKIRTHVSGHQDCGICHPEQKNLRARSRKKIDVGQVLAEIEHEEIQVREHEMCGGFVVCDYCLFTSDELEDFALYLERQGKDDVINLECNRCHRLMPKGKVGLCRDCQDPRQQNKWKGNPDGDGACLENSALGESRVRFDSSPFLRRRP